jgi:glutamate dehydrogenase
LNVERSNGSVVRLSDAQQQCADESLMIVQVGAGACSAQCLEAIKQRLGLVIQLQEDTPQLESRFHELLPHAAHVGYNKFWQWLLEGNFTPLSYRQMNIVGAGENARLELVDSASLGLPVDPALMQESLALCDPERRSCMLRSSWLVVEETNVYCPVWRNETYISIYLRQEISASEAEPQYIEHVIFGLYLANTHQQSALTIPALNSKITQALDRLNIAPCTYNFRKVEELLATFPKTELFFLSADQLDEIIKSLLFFNHSSIRVIPIDNELNSLSLLLIVPCSLSPNADFSKIETHLKRFFNAHSLITRILQFHSDYYIVQLNINSSGVIDITDLDTLNANLTNLMQSWEQKLRLILVREHGSRMGQELWHKYANVFCANYRSTIHPRFCARDIAKLERVLESKSEQVELWGPVTATNTACRLQFYSTQQGYLNELMPVLVNLDLTIIDEIDFSVTVAGRDLYIKSFGVLNKLPGSDSLLQVKTRLLDALMVLRSGLAENDYLNRLLVSTGLDWQQIDIFRGYRNYYFQLGTSFSKKTVAFALINNPRSVLALYRYFEARFKPDERWSNMMDREEQALFPARLELIDALQDVDNVNDDRILRTFFNLIDSTVRTNFYKRKGCEDYFFSFKISAIGINEMPVPRPLFEIYVHNAEMEGIHLRGGMVARGGIRWSDRPDDFRTEILGLMKTQMTKNALIVPVGSKGGFIIKQVYTEREQGMALSKRAYQTLMRGLLDLTDNRVAGKVVAPVDIIRYDEDDPYLVVAADKGTAHLPDTANGVSGEYDFWLGDGFASGGSRGYDHKELGITARGAWVCVQRHFREMTLDIQQQPFTVVGIGDMSGDVFGNGMLLSEQICLKAAFNHRHIFLDPNPDPVTTFAERQRLFDLPRSSWNDFDAALISAGGGVYERDAKEIPLSAQIQQWLGVRHESLDPDSLIQLLLRAEVDLLWNGGIGTYVKSSSQKNEDAGDRSNDSLRINGNQIRAKVIGEGGNLGMTQLARIEYALNGGRINTDAIDNSAGVDCSDHEVNLKIFMRHLIETGQVADIDERDKLLGAVTEHVSLAVLGNNYGQSLSLSLDLLRNQVERELFVDLSSRLVAVGLLDRQSETLPSTKEILARKQGYTRPELSILMAYSKMHLFRSILDDSDFLEDDSAILASYFPQPIQQQFARQLQEHPLRREIVATVITNNVIDCGGSTFCFRLARMYDVSWPAAAKAHNHFSQVIGATELRKSIYALDDSIPCTAQYKLLLEVETSINTMCDWSFSQNKGMLENSKIVPLQQYLAEFIKILSSVLDQAVWQRCQDRQDELVAYGISKDLAARFAALPVLESLLPLVSLVEELDGEIHSIALTLNEVKSRFAIDGLLAQLQHVALRDSWDRMTQHLLIMRFNHVLFRLTQKVLQEYNGNLDALLSAQRKNYQRYNTLAEQVHTQAALNFHPFVVVFEQLNSMC